MCSRFALYRTKKEITDELIPLLWDQALDYAANWNMAPTTTIPVLMYRENQPLMTGMEWGLTPSWRTEKGQPLINARMETLEE